MDKLQHSILGLMTIKEIEFLVKLYEPVGLEFWDLVDLYSIED